MRYDIIEAGKREGVAGERTGTQPLRTARFDNRGLPRIAKTLLYHSKPIMPSTRVGAIGLPAARHSRAGAPLCAVYGAEAARVLCAWCANSRRAAPDMLTGNSSGQEHGMASPQRARPPRPTTPPLATVPESWCCPPTRDSSVAPSEVSASSPSPGLCRLHPSSWKARAAPCLLDQPSQHWPHTRVSVLSPT